MMVHVAGFADVLTSPFSRQSVHAVAERFPLRDTISSDTVKAERARDFCWELNANSCQGTFFVVTQARPFGRDGEFSYAVKQLKPEWRQLPVGRAILQREAELGMLISHPHLVPVLDGNFDGDMPYLVQPWLHGKTLQEFLTLERTAKPIEAVWIVRQIAEALAVLETFDFCHSDIKPGNVIVSPNGHATLIDLGLARRIGEPLLPLDRAVVGTPKYMAPELAQTNGSQPVDLRADLYSLGLVMLEMLFGKSILSVDDMSHRINVGRWRTLWDSLANRTFQQQPLDDLESLLRSMTSIDAAKRPNSVAELVRRLISLELDLV